MKPRRVWAMARKEFLHVLRDPRSLGMAIAIPMLMLLLYGYALTLDVDEVPLVIWDQSGTPASREYISGFQASRYFRIVRQVRNYRDLEYDIDSRRAMVGLVIPTDFAPRVETGQTVRVQLAADGTDSTTASLAMGYAEVVTMMYSGRVTLSRVRRAGGGAAASPVELRPRVWYNPEMESRNYIIPGLIAIIMMIIAALITSLTVAREWERGTMEQLISTPVKGRELILGKIIPYFVIGFVDVLIAVVMGEFLFRVPLRGNVALLFVMASVFLAGALALGTLVSIVTRSQLLANQVAMVATFIPTFLLSGFIFPIHNMPRVVRFVTYIVPARYFVTILKGIYLKGVGLHVLALEASLLAVFAAVMVALANAKFKKKLV